MSDYIIQVENLTKIYKIYNKPMDRLLEVLDFTKKKYHRDFYALDNLSFNIKKGEIVGIVGKNGSGKSTLLKIITGVLSPSGGKIVVKGKISALLELGAGFNLELTGIENIFLNGIIMGYSKKEMENKLDKILSFADIGNFVHQPIKTYSSGMLVRLAFALQTEVEPDIFIVDEALAVGDALFQKRCYQKIEEMISRGTTILFVSHDQEIIRTMTQRSILISEGKIKKIGHSSDIVLEYRKILHEEEKKFLVDNLEKIKKESNMNKKMEFGDLDAEIINVEILNEKGEEESVFYPKERLNLRIKIKINKEVANLNIGIRIRNKEGIKIYSWGTLNQDIELYNHTNIKQNTFWNKKFNSNEEIEITLSTNINLGTNLYEVQAYITEEKEFYFGAQRVLHWVDEAAFFSVNVLTKEYFYGGIVDMKMKANYEVRNNETNN